MKRKRIMAGILGFSLVLAGCGINSAQTDVTPKDTTEQLAKAETSEETENFTTQTTEIQTEPETETQVEPVVQKVTITAVGDCTFAGDDRKAAGQSCIYLSNRRNKKKRSGCRRRCVASR